MALLTGYAAADPSGEKQPVAHGSIRTMTGAAALGHHAVRQFGAGRDRPRIGVGGDVCELADAVQLGPDEPGGA